MNARSEMIGRVGKRLGTRQLVWFGTRGDDIESITDLPNLGASLTITAPFRSRAKVRSVALDELTGSRVDLDVYEIDDDVESQGVGEMRDALLRLLTRPSALVAYRPSAWVSAVAFARSQHCLHVGMFKDHQVAFEHKPWVESSLRAEGIDAIDWRYVADEDQLQLLADLTDGPLILRPSRSCGGVGMARVATKDDLMRHWPERPDSLVSVAPFLDPVVPVNVGAVVWDNAVTIHPGSVQLIGISGLANRMFGYCGNDFGAFSELGTDIITEVEQATRTIGHWLQRHGYRGAFGVDYLVHEGKAVFTEVNPRFQGSTHLSSYISVARGEPCILLEHLAAHLGLEPNVNRSFVEQSAEVTRMAHMVVHRREPRESTVDLAEALGQIGRLPAFLRADLVPARDVALQHGAAACRISVKDRVTSDGFSLTDDWSGWIAGVSEAASGTAAPAAHPSLR